MIGQTEKNYLKPKKNLYIHIYIGKSVARRIPLLNYDKKERFYTRGTLTSIRIPRLAKIPTLYRNWLSSLK